MSMLLFLILSLEVFAVGLSGLIASRHFLIMVFSIELMLVSSTLLATTFYYYGVSSNIGIFLFAVWAVMASEVIAVVAVYRYLQRADTGMDVKKLSDMKW